MENDHPCGSCNQQVRALSCPRGLCGICCGQRRGASFSSCSFHDKKARRKARKRRGLSIKLGPAARQHAATEERKRGLNNNQMSVSSSSKNDQNRRKRRRIMEKKSEPVLSPSVEPLATATTSTSVSKDQNQLTDVIMVQAEELVHLRREMKDLRVAYEKLKRKRLHVKQGLCIICEERAYNRLLVPCGHLYCSECIKDEAKCPICKTKVDKRHKFHPPTYICDDAVCNSTIASSVLFNNNNSTSHPTTTTRSMPRHILFQ